MHPPPSLRCQSAVPGPPGSLEACGGGAPPSRSGCSRAGPRRKPVWKISQRRRDCAGAGRRPAPGAGTMTAQHIRRYTPGGPSTQIRALTPHTHSPAQPEPRGQCPDGRRVHPRPATAGAIAQRATGARPQAKYPCHPDTQTRPQRPLGPARRSPRPLRPGGLTWPSSGLRSAPLPPRLAPARPWGCRGGMGPARGGSALPRHGDTRSRGRGTGANSHAPPPVLMPRPV